MAITDDTNNAFVILLNAGPTSGADVAVGVNLSQTSSPAGGKLKYTATVYSEGPQDATDVVLTETLPASWKFDLAQASQGTCTGTTTISCDLGSMASGAAATVQFQVTPTQAGTFSDSLAVTAAQPDLNMKNNSASFNASIVLPADIGVSCVPSEPTGAVGDQVSFTVTVSNAGPADATNVSLQDILSDPLPVSSLTASQGSCTYAANTISCGLGALSSGSIVIITFAVSMQSAEVFANYLSAKANQFDINSANNKATVSVKVNQPDFSLAADSSALTGTNGTQLTDQVNITDLNGFSGSISLTCSITGAAPMPACSLLPGTIPAGTKTPNSTLTINVPGSTATQSSPFEGWSSRPFYNAGFLLPGIALFGLGFAMRTPRKRLRYAWVLCAFVFAFMALQTGCGGGSSTPPPPVSQSYVVTVTATSGSVQHSVTVTLTVN